MYGPAKADERPSYREPWDPLIGNEAPACVPRRVGDAATVERVREKDQAELSKAIPEDW